MDFYAQWITYQGNQCNGFWAIEIDRAKPLNLDLLRSPLSMYSHMDTYGYYKRTFIDSNGELQSIFYTDGLISYNWIDRYRYAWQLVLEDANIINSTLNMLKLYNAINQEDWRYYSCGSCM